MQQTENKTLRDLIEDLGGFVSIRAEGGRSVKMDTEGFLKWMCLNYMGAIVNYEKEQMYVTKHEPPKYLC